MGIDYSFYLRVGFSLPESVVQKSYMVDHEEVSHYEDRFDPKTGVKLKPKLVIDQPGGEWFEIKVDEDILDSMWEVVEETDFFQNKFDCKVSSPFDHHPGIVNFFFEVPGSASIDCGRVNVYHTHIPLSWIEDNKTKLNALREKLKKEFGVDPGEPAVFVESMVG
ncbi:MAG TPA: hypothetical protein VJS91_09645 [Nitrososphaeraceae archaeon]|nr:hypothetical protein [Nitrososphaeraceae archaeon]